MPQQQEETEQTRVLSPVLGADSRLEVMKVRVSRAWVGCALDRGWAVPGLV